MSHFIVTGASGYIGRHVVHSLANQGHRVVAMVREATQVDFSDAVTVVEGSIWDHDNELLAQYAPGATLIHLAWRDGFVHNSHAHMADLSSHFTFVETLISLGLQKFIGLGSMHELGPVTGKVGENSVAAPITQYGIAKNALRLSLADLCARNEVGYLWLRCFYILGDDAKNSSVFTKMLELEAAGAQEMPLTLGTSKFDFIDVRELGLLIAQVSTLPDTTGLLNLGSGNVMSLRERIEQFRAENHLNIDMKFGVFPERQGIGEGCWPDLSRLAVVLGA